MPQPWLYTLPDCAHCIQAKALLVSMGTVYTEVPVDNPLLIQAMQHTFGTVLVPILATGQAFFIFNDSGNGPHFAKIVFKPKAGTP